MRDLVISFAGAGQPVPAVRGVTFGVRSREIVALVGESGCGKSVTALALTRLLGESARYVGGTVLFEGRDTLSMGEKELRQIRGKSIAYVFQEPGGSLNPVFRVGTQIAEGVRLHRPEADVEAEILRLMEWVGLPDPQRTRLAYPHQLSGGMQQRVMIAMALASQPKLLVADEPTTALDVTIQAQIMELLYNLRERLGMAVLLITHNLGLVADVADRVCIMYCGAIVETGSAAAVLSGPMHPYTRGLLQAVPSLEGAPGRMKGIDGVVPAPNELGEGCSFGPRCASTRDACREGEPKEIVVEGEHSVRCHCWR